ncbi:TPA: hypothetical protein N0F65_009372 [Lagenidium giganteum]|uniref:Prolyl 4-hydroxylase alpha subunit domain-containing protein n=1 Tax=Lagenidium giganteum TaxID=4803 RepID=A0AAV2ZJ06_9STRA|nr:TPA: hypothetical protein N0F65_009372 [Lagenidium giganteum]
MKESPKGTKKPAAKAGNDSAKSATMSATKPAASSSSSSTLLFVVVPLLVAAIGGAWNVFGPPQTDSEPIVSRGLSTNASAKAHHESARGVFVPKYESSLVHIYTQKLLVPSSTKCPTFKATEDLAHVEEAMQLGAEALRAKNQVFIMLNGQNEGLYVPWRTGDGCLFELATAAAKLLGADIDLLPNGVKLMTQMGLPIESPEELDGEAGRIAHVLLDGQIWVWPGIRVGHQFQVEDCTVRTLSLKPKVFAVENFFNEEEAQTIIDQGSAHLARSPVDSPDAVDGYHADRTSDTAFLNDNEFTRDFRARTANLARLPSPSFVERLQLVRYKKGQFFRKHEDYFDSKQFLNKKAQSNEDYKAWTIWAAKRIDELNDKANTDLPDEFRFGGNMYPDFEDKSEFQLALLGAFMEDAEKADFFMEHADLEWGKWIRENMETRASDIMTPLLADKGYMLRHIINSWEKRAKLPELKYQIPKRDVSPVTHYFRWIRWAKERVQDLLDEDPESVPEAFRPAGDYYPTYHISYQNILVNFVLEDNSKEDLVAEFGEEWAEWLIGGKDSNDILLEGLRVSELIFDKVVESFTKRAGDKFAYSKPKHLRHFEPNRFVTVFLYLNECPEGGETVFPYSKERLVTGINRDGMAECSDGLAVPPRRLTASMFYSQTPENAVDPSSMHGGCPPADGVKYGSNSFAWNADADEGANAWDLGSNLKTHPEA